LGRLVARGCESLRRRLTRSRSGRNSRRSVWLALRLAIAWASGRHRRRDLPYRLGLATTAPATSQLPLSAERAVRMVPSDRTSKRSEDKTPLLATDIVAIRRDVPDSLNQSGRPDQNRRRPATSATGRSGAVRPVCDRFPRKRVSPGVALARLCRPLHAYARPSAERRGWDSNPRGRLTPPTRFPVALLKPLGHLSGDSRVLARSVRSDRLGHWLGRARGLAGRSRWRSLFAGVPGAQSRYLRSKRPRARIDSRPKPTAEFLAAVREETGEPQGLRPRGRIGSARTHSAGLPARARQLTP
jgi:hypothetical protein